MNRFHVNKYGSKKKRNLYRCSINLVANIYLPEEQTTVMACSRHLEAVGREGGEDSTTAELVLHRMRGKDPGAGPRADQGA